MDVVDLPLTQLREASWNSNRMDADMTARLRESVLRYGLVQPLVVRPMDERTYEVLSGNQKVDLLRQAAQTKVPCIVVELDDARARLLAQALNHIRGEDDLGLRAEVIRGLLDVLPEQEVLAVLPESAESLHALASLGQEDLAAHLEAWQAAQGARLKHLQVQLTPGQMEVVVQALERALTGPIPAEGNPNRRGNALVAICRAYLKAQEGIT